MASFDEAVRVTLAHEGGYADDPDDPGGVTNFGISFVRHSHELPEWFWKDAEEDPDLLAQQRAAAVEIYRRSYWNPRYEEILSQPVATRLFDLGVNLGPSQAVRLLQAALNARESRLDIDGVFGPKTLSAVTLADPHQLDFDFGNQAARFYYGLAEKRPRQRNHLFRWMRRALGGIPCAR